MSTWRVSYNIGPSCGYETFDTEDEAMRFVEMLHQDIDGTDEDDYCIDYWEVAE